MKKITPLSKDSKLNNHADLSDEQFAEAFKNCTLPPSLFSHEAHLRLAWIHLKKDDLETAITTICDQLTAFVNHVGARDKYHKTLTVAAVKIVAHFMQRFSGNKFFDFIVQCPELKTNFKDLIKSHYSFDIFNSEQAKMDYLEPNLLPFES